MDQSSKDDQEIIAKARSQGIVAYFEIRKLYGYRTVSMRMDGSATILIAQNGAGKTTLLSALNAILTGRLLRLAELDFESIILRFSDDEECTIYKSDLALVFDTESNLEFFAEAKRLQLPPKRLKDYLLGSWSAATFRDDYFNTTSFLDEIVHKCGGLHSVESTVEDLFRALYSTSSNLREVQDQVFRRLNGIEVVYLPTYRRIELALAQEEDNSPNRPKKPDIKFASDVLFAGTMQFGLGDISDQLSNIHRSILTASNEGYRRISAKIINDLIDGEFSQKPVGPRTLPSQEDLQIFFDRLTRSSRHMPFNNLEIPNLQKIYSQEIDAESNLFLTYFLENLNSVIKITNELERPVRLFVETCNKYLGSEDPSIGTYGRKKRPEPVDAKELVLNRDDLSVSVRSIEADISIKLDSLSSGEKQMISLFANMFLGTKDKLVLIDEPELSLSLDWQSHILPDILLSPTCRQLIAITHSPFVFENALERFARPLQLHLEL